MRTLSDTECRISVFAIKTQMTNSFKFRCVGNRSIYLFRTPPPLFGQGEWTHIFFGAPSQDDFFPTTVLRFGCVLEETHGITYLKVVREVLKEGKELKVNVTELYVIRS